MSDASRGYLFGIAVGLFVGFILGVLFAAYVLDWQPPAVKAEQARVLLRAAL